MMKAYCRLSNGASDHRMLESDLGPPKAGLDLGCFTEKAANQSTEMLRNGGTKSMGKARVVSRGTKGQRKPRVHTGYVLSDPRKIQANVRKFASDVRDH